MARNSALRREIVDRTAASLSECSLQVQVSAMSQSAIAEPRFKGQSPTPIDVAASKAWLEANPRSPLPLLTPSNANCVHAWSSLPKQLHPIFRVSNFCTSLDEKDDQQDFYQHIFPALQIASQMLKSKQSLSFWYGALHNVTENMICNAEGESAEEASFTAQADLTQSQIEETLSFLLLLAERVFFSAEMPEQEDHCGMTYEAWFEGLGTFEERHSFICVNAAEINAVRGAEYDPRPAAHKDLSLAMTFLHELAHAGCALLRGHGNEMYFAQQDTREIGFAYESFLLGGGVLVFLKYDNEELALDAWPNKSMSEWNAEHYGSESLRCGCAAEQPDRTWLLEPNAIDKYFSAEFWTGDAANDERAVCLAKPKRAVSKLPALIAEGNSERVGDILLWLAYCRCNCREAPKMCSLCAQFEVNSTSADGVAFTGCQLCYNSQSPIPAQKSCPEDSVVEQGVGGHESIAKPLRKG